MAEGDGAAVDVEPGRVGAHFAEPGEGDGGEGLVDFVEVDVGDAMSLIVLLPGERCPTSIDLALVRWVQDQSFGVEFVSVGSAEVNRLRQFLSSIRVSE